MNEDIKSEWGGVGNIRFIESKLVEGCDHEGSKLTIYPRREVCNWYDYIFKDMNHCDECCESDSDPCAVHTQNFKDYDDNHIHDSTCKKYTLARTTQNDCKVCDEIYDCCGRGDCGIDLNE